MPTIKPGEKHTIIMNEQFQKAVWDISERLKREGKLHEVIGKKEEVKRG